jgi:hypothetical protein
MLSYLCGQVVTFTSLADGVQHGVRVRNLKLRGSCFRSTLSSVLAVAHRKSSGRRTSEEATLRR